MQNENREAQDQETIDQLTLYLLIVRFSAVWSLCSSRDSLNTTSSQQNDRIRSTMKIIRKRHAMKNM
jgi:hypothetical protein